MRKLDLRLFVLVFIGINAGVLLYSVFFKETVFPGGVELGFPYVFYEEFKMSGGWYLKNFIKDQVIYFFLSVVIYIGITLLINNKRRKVNSMNTTSKLIVGLS